MTDSRFNCPHCNQPLEAPDDVLGLTINCPICQGQITLAKPIVPQITPSAPPQPPEMPPAPPEKSIPPVSPEGRDSPPLPPAPKRNWPWQTKAVAIAVGALFLDLSIVWSATDLLGMVAPAVFLATTYLIYGVLGLALATVVFKERNLVALVVVSLSASLVLRCALVAVMFPVLQAGLEEPLRSMGPAVAKAFWVTLIQGICVYLPLLAGIRFLRKTEAQFGFEAASAVEIGAEFDEGTCMTCGKRTVVAASRWLSFLGKSHRYFCQHCHNFIGGNPVDSALQGLAQSVTTSFFFVCLAAGMGASASDQSTFRLAVLSALIFGAFDGLRKVIVSCWVICKVRRAR